MTMRGVTKILALVCFAASADLGTSFYLTNDLTKPMKCGRYNKAMKKSIGRIQPLSTIVAQYHHRRDLLDEMDTPGGGEDYNVARKQDGSISPQHSIFCCSDAAATDRTCALANIQKDPSMLSSSPSPSFACLFLSRFTVEEMPSSKTLCKDHEISGIPQTIPRGNEFSTATMVKSPAASSRTLSRQPTARATASPPRTKRRQQAQAILSSRDILLGYHEGRDIRVKVSRYGAYLQWGSDGAQGTTTHPIPPRLRDYVSTLPDYGDIDEEDKAQSIVVGMGLTLAKAIAYISLPRTVTITAGGDPIIVAMNWQGPYLRFKNELIPLIEEDGENSVFNMNAVAAESIVQERLLTSKPMGAELFELGQKQGYSVTIHNGPKGPYVQWKESKALLPFEYREGNQLFHLSLQEAQEFLFPSPPPPPSTTTPLVTKKANEGSALEEIEDVGADDGDDEEERLPSPPKRPRSAFIHFCVDKKEALDEEMLKQPLIDIARELVRLWKSASDEEQAFYESKASNHLQEYWKQVEEWNANVRKQLHAVGPRAASMLLARQQITRPDPPRTSYAYFCDEARPELEKMNDDYTPEEVANQLAVQWCDLRRQGGAIGAKDQTNMQTLEYYLELEAADQRRYQHELQVYDEELEKEANRILERQLSKVRQRRARESKAGGIPQDGGGTSQVGSNQPPMQQNQPSSMNDSSFRFASQAQRQLQKERESKKNPREVASQRLPARKMKATQQQQETLSSSRFSKSGRSTKAAARQLQTMERPSQGTPPARKTKGSTPSQFVSRKLPQKKQNYQTLLQKQEPLMEDPSMKSQTTFMSKQLSTTPVRGSKKVSNEKASGTISAASKTKKKKSTPKKRPPTAYMLFCREYRNTVLDDDGKRLSASKSSTRLAQMWKTCDEATRTKFQVEAAAEADRMKLQAAS